MIKLAFQNWSERYQWYVPNSVAENSIESGILPETHGMAWFNVPTDFYFKIKQDDNLIKEVFKHEAFKNDILSLNQLSTYTKLSDIGDEPYIFPINIKNINYFNRYRDVGLRYISSRVFDDVRRNKTKIVFIMPYEGASGAKNLSAVSGEQDFEILNKWCTDAGLTRDQVYYINGNQLSPEMTKEMNFTAIPVDVFYGWIHKLHNTVAEFKPVDHRNLFLSYNRMARVHRTVLLCLLIRYNLLDRGLVSYTGANLKNFTKAWLKSNDVDGISDEEATKLDDMVPMYLDMDLIQNNPASNIHPIHYENTFVSVITETLCAEGTVFFSEKIWKTISIGHPFIVLGSVGFLKELKKNGYKTFDRWINESYDSEPDLLKRTELITQELSRFSKMSIAELASIRDEMKAVLEHNQQLFNNNWNDRIKNRSYEYVIYKEIETIWNTMK